MIGIEAFQDGIITSVQELLIGRLACTLVYTSITGCIDERASYFKYGITLPRAVNFLFFLVPFKRRMQQAMYAIQFFNYFSAAIGVVLSLFVEVDYLPILFFVLNFLYGIAVIIANTALFLDWEMNSRIYQHGLKRIAIAAVFVVIGQVLIVFSLLKDLSWYQ